MSFTGTDILRVSNGLLTEYWINSDTLLLMQQLARVIFSDGVASQRGALG